MTLQASVIIPTFEDWGGLQACLDCLGRQTIDQAAFEVIVANNNPSPDLPQTLRIAPNTRIIHEARPGSYAARNAALNEARADVLFFTDSDCQPDPGWIAAGLAAITPIGPHGRIAGAVEFFCKGEAWTASELYDRVHYLRQKDYSRYGWCATANLVARRTTFDMVGPFNAELFSLGDNEWGKRAFAMGSPIIFDPDTLVRHPARPTFAEMAKKRRRMAGGTHDGEMVGRYTRRGLKSLLSFVSYVEFRRTMTHPGLTEWQRLQVLWVCFRLGTVGFAETMRLRCLSGTPRRS
jgi:glycosyltransferase involved in cell wall biosynthesis